MESIRGETHATFTIELPYLVSFKLISIPVHADNEAGADVDLQYLHRQRLGRALQLPYFFRGHLVQA